MSQRTVYGRDGIGTRFMQNKSVVLESSILKQSQIVRLQEQSSYMISEPHYDSLGVWYYETVWVTRNKIQGPYIRLSPVPVQ